MSSSQILLTLLFYTYTFSAAEPSAKRLGKPLIGDDGIIYACSGKFFNAFNSDGSMTWSVHLNYTCNGGITPVYGGKRKVYIVAENRVLMIDSLSIGTPEPAVELFFGNASAEETSDEIIGLAASMLTSSIYMNIRNKGLSSHSLRGKLRWSVEPVLNQSEYHQGCRKSISDCYFTSVPVIDYCEASLYVSTNQGELYSISTRRPHFKWIQDLSSFDREFTATPGNNGRLYVVLPAKTLVLGLDVSTGDVLWQRSIGPLSSAQHSPAVDSNGWISIGSLDGFLYSISPMGVVNKFSKVSPKDSVVQVGPVLDCSGYGVYVSQTVMEGKSSLVISDYMFVSAMKPKNVVFSFLVPAVESFYWSEIYPGQFSSNLSQSYLKNFLLDEEIVLTFIAAAKIGNPLACRNTRQKLALSCSEVRPKSVDAYTGSERTIFLFLFFQTVMLVILGIIVRFCCMFWSKQKLQNQDLGKFLDKRRSLWIKKKEFDQTIFELEHKAAEEATTTNDVLEKLSDLVKEREGLKRKLSTSYSLGRDRANSAPKNVLPLYGGKTRSNSFQGTTKRETVTIFHTPSCSSDDDVDVDDDDDDDDDEQRSSQETDFEQYLSREIELDVKAKAKGKAKVDDEPTQVVSCSCSDEEEDSSMEEESYGGTSSASSLTSGSPRYYSSDEPRKLSSEDERPNMEAPHDDRGRAWLKRRRSLSSAY